jgi:hypothetical protein
LPFAPICPDTSRPCDRTPPCVVGNCTTIAGGRPPAPAPVPYHGPLPPCALADRLEIPPGPAAPGRVCDVPRLCAAIDKCAARMNREIQDDPEQFAALQFMLKGGELAGPGRVLASRPRCPAGGVVPIAELDQLLDVARAAKLAIIDRKKDRTSGTRVDESLFQYASGMVAGAIEVVNALERASGAIGVEVVRVGENALAPAAWPLCRCGHGRGDHDGDGDCAADGGCPCGLYAPALGADGGPGGVRSAALSALRDAPDATPGVTPDRRAADARAVGRERDAADRAPGRAAAGADGAALPGVEGRPLTDARGIPVASVAAVHVDRIAATLRAAGVCACAACTAFAVAHELDVFPMLAPAIAGRYAPGHGPTPGEERNPDRHHKVSHPTTVTRRRRGKK